MMNKLKKKMSKPQRVNIYYLFFKTNQSQKLKPTTNPLKNRVAARAETSRRKPLSQNGHLILLELMNA